MKNSQIQQYKYFKVLVQEFHVKVDLGFVNSIMEVFDTSAKSEEEQVTFSDGTVLWYFLFYFFNSSKNTF